VRGLCKSAALSAGDSEGKGIRMQGGAVRTDQKVEEKNEENGKKKGEELQGESWGSK